MSLIIYGHPASQPSRTVYWACLLGKLPFILGSTRESILDTRGTNPRGQVPSITDGDFSLSEASAIVWYLGQKHGWVNMYPEGFQEQARVHQFLHMHHQLVRLATYHLMAPHVVKPLNFPQSDPNPLSLFQTHTMQQAFAEDDPHEAGGKIVTVIVAFLEESYFFEDSSYLCGGDHATVADLVCYSEIGQLYFAKLFDFTPYPNFTRWLQAMRNVPYHDVANAYNIELGDILTEPNTRARFSRAGEKGLQALIDTGLASQATL
jgi:glutathione S-transferase